LPAEQLLKLLNSSGIRELFDSRKVTCFSQDVAIVQTVDFFTPVTANPRFQGRIAATNVLNDLYAMGIPKILSFSIILGLKRDTPQPMAKQILRGIKDLCDEVGTKIVGGHTAVFCDVIVGGSAVAMIEPKKLVFPKGAKSGDLLVLTKPLGSQLAMLASYLENYGLIQEGVLSNELREYALRTMSHPANKVAEALYSHGANAATDITGFGLLGHASQIALNSGVDLNFDFVPVLRGSIKLAEALKKDLKSGMLPETAGGILICVRQEDFSNLEEALKKGDELVLLVGRVTEKKGSLGRAIISQNATIEEI